MGVLFGAFGVIQHYSDDPFALLETPGQVRVSSTAGNPIFAASVLLMTICVSLTLATANLRYPLNTSRYWAQMGLWVSVLGVQGLAIMFTLSRGPWLGTILSVGMFLALVAAFLGRRVLLRAGLIVVLTGALMAAFVWTIDPLLRPSEVKNNTGDTVIDRFGTITG